jgi:hypothetical protein
VGDLCVDSVKEYSHGRVDNQEKSMTTPAKSRGIAGKLTIQDGVDSARQSESFPTKTLPEPISETILSDCWDQASGVYVERRNDDKTKDTGVVSHHPQKPIDRVTDHEQEQSVYFNWAGRFPTHTYDDYTAPKKEDIVLRTSIGLDLDVEKRSDQYQDVEDVKKGLERFFSMFNWDRGVAIETNEDGGLNVLIPLRPTNDGPSTKNDASTQTYRILKLLNGTDDLPGLLGPMGADPDSTRRIGNMRLPGVERDGHKITCEWIEGESGPDSKDGRASWWGIEDFFMDHAVNFLAYRSGLYTPSDCERWKPKGDGLSRFKTAWALLVYLIHSPDCSRMTYAEIASELEAIWDRDITEKHVSRALDVLGSLNVIEANTEQGRNGGTTIDLIAEHDPEESPYRDYYEYEDDREKTSRSNSEACRTPKELMDHLLNDVPNIGERHQKIVETAFFLAGNGFSRDILYLWFREKVPKSGGRTITDKELDRAWDRAERMA